MIWFTIWCNSSSNQLSILEVRQKSKLLMKTMTSPTMLCCRTRHQKPKHNRHILLSVRQTLTQWHYLTPAESQRPDWHSRVLAHWQQTHGTCTEIVSSVRTSQSDRHWHSGITWHQQRVRDRTGIAESSCTDAKHTEHVLRLWVQWEQAHRCRCVRSQHLCNSPPLPSCTHHKNHIILPLTRVMSSEISLGKFPEIYSNLSEYFLDMFFT